MINWKLNLAVLSTGQFLGAAGTSMIAPFLPYFLQQDLGVTEPHQVALWASCIFAANYVSSFLFQPLWGKLADRRGRKLMVLRSGFGMAICIGLMGLAASPWWLLAMRLLNGMISGFKPAAVAMLAATTPRAHAGLAMGTMQSATVAGTILGPLISGLLAGWIGYRAIFYLTGGLLLLAALAVLGFAREQFDAEQAAKRPNVSIYQGFAQLCRIRPLPSLFATTAIIHFALVSTIPILPLYVQQLHGPEGMLALYAGMVVAITGFSNMLAAPLFGRWGDRIGFERILLGSLIGAAICSVPQALAAEVWQLMAARFLLGVCIGGLLPSVNALLAKHASEGMESRVYSFNASALSFGSMIGPIAGGLLSGLIGLRGIFIVAALLFAVNAGWAAHRGRRTAELPTRADQRQLGE